VSPTESDDRFVYFDAASVSLYQVGSGGPATRSTATRATTSRAWASTGIPFKDGRTSVRAAYALLSDQPVTNLVSQTAGNPPLVTPLSFTGAAGSIRLDNALTVAQASGLAPLSVDDSFRNPRLQTWNVNVQRQLRRNLSAMVGYFGSKGDFLRIALNQNQITNGVRPYPRLSASSPILPGSALGNITNIASHGYSRYNGVWVTLNQRISHGLQFNGSYTWSKSKDTNSLNSTNVAPQDSTNIAGDYGYSDYDARHRYRPQRDLGPARSRATAQGRLADLVITQGRPATRSPSSRTRTSPGRQHHPPGPDRQPRGLRAPGAVVLDGRLRPARGRFLHLELGLRAALHERRGPHGNFPRNGVYGPGFYNTDLSLIKRTKIAGTSLELRAEAFNVFNHPNLGFPLAARTAVPGGTAFGVITTTRLPTGDSGSARQIQFAAKLLF
jgi:hypothetical protein